MTNKTRKDLPSGYKMLADIIPTGQENAIKLDNIMKMAGIKDKRTAYEIIERLIIRYGYTILANRTGDNVGYFIPKDEQELNECIKPFLQSVNSMQKRYTALIHNFYNKEIN